VFRTNNPSCGTSDYETPWLHRYSAHTNKLNAATTNTFKCDQGCNSSRLPGPEEGGSATISQVAQTHKSTHSKHQTKPWDCMSPTQRRNWYKTKDKKRRSKGRGVLTTGCCSPWIQPQHIEEEGVGWVFKREGRREVEGECGRKKRHTKARRFRTMHAWGKHMGRRPVTWLFFFQSGGRGLGWGSAPASDSTGASKSWTLSLEPAKSNGVCACGLFVLSETFNNNNKKGGGALLSCTSVTQALRSTWVKSSQELLSGVHVHLGVNGLLAHELQPPEGGCFM